MKTLKDFNFKNKRVLVRCDFNVPLNEKGEVADDFRIKNSIPTIEYLIKKRAKVILMSHLGNPGGRVVEDLRLTPIQEKLMEYLDLSITKAPDCVGSEIKKWISQMKPGEILLLENLRFHKEEKENDKNFAKELAELGDIFINDAFSVCHRAHASVVGVPKYLPSGIGFLLEKEIKNLSKIIKKPKKPVVIIIGGAKISTKAKVIEDFFKKADHLLLGGKIANFILIQKGLLIGKIPVALKTEEIIEKLELPNPKLHLPVDGIVSLRELKDKENYIKVKALGQIKRGEDIYDIGPDTLKLFSKIIKEAKTIFWSGPLGMFEERFFEKGTKEIAISIAENKKAFKVAGGGETVLAINRFGLLDKFDHISTGGGAMLEFLTEKRLPGLEVLK